MSPSPAGQGGLVALKAFARAGPVADRCDLCARALPPRHDHLLHPKRRELKCSCPACALLFRPEDGAAWRKVPPRVQRLPELVMDDGDWSRLQLPIDLAYFQRSSVAGEVRAFFPSPAGATESQLPEGAWDALVRANPSLAALEEDVETLLVNRVGTSREAYRVSVDVCFELVGLVRREWRGLSGGQEAWRAIGEFFLRLEREAHA